MRRHDLESLRRSAAIGNGLPPSAVHELLEACDHLLTERERIEDVLRRLGPAWTDARAALNELAALLRSSGV